MSEAVTPAAAPSGTPSTPPAATPANSAPETVTLDKQAHDQLVRDAARASEAQSRADRLESVLKKNGLMGGSGHFKSATPATPPTPEERQEAGAEEDRKAQLGLMALAIDPAYREILDNDQTLREMLIKNPLAVLPLLAPDALDADDAVSLVKEALNKRKPAPAPATPPAATPPTPPAGGVNPQDKPVDENVEAARKIPNTEHAIAGMVAARLKSQGKK